MAKLALIYFLSVNVLFLCAMALDFEEIKQKYIAIVGECSKEHKPSTRDMERLRDRQSPQEAEGKCFLACTYKKSGMMNEQGYMSVEGIRSTTSLLLANDPGQMNQANQFIDACQYVNEVAVSDGERGCERASLLFECSVTKAAQFGFVI